MTTLILIGLVPASPPTTTPAVFYCNTLNWLEFQTRCFTGNWIKPNEKTINFYNLCYLLKVLLPFRLRPKRQHRKVKKWIVKQDCPTVVYLQTTWSYRRDSINLYSNSSFRLLIAPRFITRTQRMRMVNPDYESQEAEWKIQLDREGEGNPA